MILRPPRATRTYTPFPYTPLFRSPVTRILTTHVGALQRPPEAEAALLGELGDAGEDALRSAVADVVRKQVEVGIDIVDDGEFGKSIRSEEHTSELQSLMRISYAVFCLKKNKKV